MTPFWTMKLQRKSATKSFVFFRQCYSFLFVTFFFLLSVEKQLCFEMQELSVTMKTKSKVGRKNESRTFVTPWSCWTSPQLSIPRQFSTVKREGLDLMKSLFLEVFCSHIFFQDAQGYSNNCHESFQLFYKVLLSSSLNTTMVEIKNLQGFISISQYFCLLFSLFHFL